MNTTQNFNISFLNKLFVFTFILSALTYGFALTNFTLSIDNETPIYDSHGMDLGRWGTNLLKYHLFNGHLVYFTQLIGLMVFSICSIRLVKLFKFEGVSAYFFCVLFVTFPQLSYQLVFYMMADLGAIGVLLSILTIELYMNIYDKPIYKKLLYYLIIALILMFIIAIYQAFLIVPATVLLILLFQKSFENSFNLFSEIKKILTFGGITVVSIVFYYLSVKILCPPIENSSYISSFVSTGSQNTFISFILLVKNHLLGNAYYGEKFFLLVPILSFILCIKMFTEKKGFVLKLLFLLALIISPFVISFLNSAGYNPPRLYLTSNLIFAFIIVFTINIFKVSNHNIIKLSIAFILIFNFYFITNLFFTVNKICKHDITIAENIDAKIQNKYPDFYTTEKYVYFYGGLPFDYHQKFRLENSEIFGGSIYSWDNGSNYRLLNFFSKSEVANYKMVETKEMYDSFKDSIAKMPVWPNHESVKKFNNVVVVKLGENKGAPLFFE
jgi:Glucosyl transferase GtrII